MADIDRPVGIVKQGRSRSGSYSKSSDGRTILSPDVADAMDRIFPKSPSKFLKNPFSDDHSLLQVSHNKSKVVSTCRSSILGANQSLACTVSNAHITTDTTTTATAIFTGLSTSASRTKSPIMSSVPAYSSDVPSLPASAIVENNVSEQNGDVASKPKSLSKSRVSKADLELCGQTIVDSPRTVILEKLSSQQEPVNRLDDVKTKTKKKYYSKSSIQMEVNKIERQKLNELLSTEKNNKENFVSEISNVDEILSFTCTDPSNIAIDTNGHIAHPSAEMISNESPLNVSYSAYNSQQKLPKLKRHFLHVSKDVKYIRKKLLPCFVVLKRTDYLLLEENPQLDKLDLALSERIKHLAIMCTKDRIDCPKVQHIEYVLQHKNIFEESILGNNSEDEFVSPRGRSLRKRNHNVCYKEPSEDDLLMEISSPKSKDKRKLKQNDSSDSDNVQEKKNNKSNVESDQVIALEPEKTIMSNVESSIMKSSIDSEKTINVEALKTHLNNNTVEKQKSLIKSDNQNKASEKASVNEGKQKSHHVKKASQETVRALGLKDKEGRSLVYVYPKSSVVNTKRPGPASKTQKPMHVIANASSVPPVSTLSLPRSLLSHVGRSASTATTLMQQSSPLFQPPIGGSVTSSQFYMVKIDGKDFLVPMVAGGAQSSRPSTANTVTLPSNALTPTGCRLMLQSLSGLPTPQAVHRPGSSPILTQPPFGGTRYSVMLPPPPVSSAIRMVTTTQMTSNVSIVPTINNSQAVATCIPSVRPSHVPSSTVIPPSVVGTASISLPHGSTSLVSLVRPPSVSTISVMPSSQSTTKSLTNTPGSLLGSPVVPLAAPASTTVLRSSNRPRTDVPTVTTATQIVASSATATGPRCFRFIVPGCTATGTPARIATLGTPTNSSPLTRMAVSSALLPQRKRSVDKEVSPEKRAAKRRRLEKKYPLPPGVVIKTEPLDNPRPASIATVQPGSVRSLLGQNIQLITSGSRGGSGTVQNIRIVAPNMGSRQVRLSSNVIIRAPNVSAVGGASGSVTPLAVSGQSLVIVTPSQNSTAITPSSTQALNSISSVRIAHSTNVITSTSANAATNSNTSLAEVVSSSSATTTTTITTASKRNTTSLLATSASSTHSSVSTSGSPPDKITTLSYPVSSPSIGTSCSVTVSSSTSSSKDKTPANSGPNSATANKPSDVEALKQSIENLRKFIRTQENVGLQGGRLKKLKELLMQKESAFIDLQSASVSTDSAKENNSSQAVPMSSASADVIVID